MFFILQLKGFPVLGPKAFKLELKGGSKLGFKKVPSSLPLGL